jgi:NAD(P)-dependent dehydrogenase (short-subunit alcohol dehydrogenase family)
VVVVTGGGRGIGAATAQLAARRGYAVCVNYLRNRKPPRASWNDREEGRRRGRGGGRRGARSRRGAHVRRGRALGRIAALVNNAGILERQIAWTTWKPRASSACSRPTSPGAFLCAREAVRRMSTRHGGAGGGIVNVSSMASRLGSPGEYVDYAASKGAIDSLTIGLSKEVAEEGIRVNAVRPGVIYTEIHATGGEPGRVDRVKAAVPLKRGGQPEEVAQAILWLLSDESSYSTGTFIDVSGGR